MKGRRKLSVLVAIVLTFGMVPSPALAYEGEVEKRGRVPRRRNNAWRLQSLST